MEALNEVYFGRGPVEPLQKQITKLRNKLAFKPVTSNTNMDPEVLKFNRLAESIFGFNSFSLYIQPNNMPNAYAFPVDTYFADDERKKILNAVISSPTGFKYDKAFAQVNLVIAIHTGLLEMTEITDEEIMATILHEIGHGFFEAITDNECEFSTARKIIAMMTDVTKFAKDKVAHGKFVTEKIIDMELSRFNGMISGVAKHLNKVKNKIFKKFVHESMEDNMKKNRIDYTNEKFADTFAAMYGYGEECHSGDIKIFNVITKEFYGVKTYSHLAEIVKMYKMYSEDFLAYILGIQDPHPAELARIKTTADYLKRELAKEGLDPKMKKEMMDQLNKVYDLIEAYKNFPKDQDSMRILRLYHIKLYEKFGGDRRERDTDNDALFAAIDNRYDALSRKEDS